MCRKLLHPTFTTLFVISPLLEAVTDTEKSVAETSLPTESVEVPEAELVEMVGYLVAQTSQVFSLNLDESGIAEMAGGLKKGLIEGLAPDTSEQGLETAFDEAQTRAKAVESGSKELPGFSEGSLETIGLVIFAQAGLQQLGFEAKDAPQIVKGFIAGASTAEVPSEIQAKMPSFQNFMQKRVQMAQKKMMQAQEAARKATMIEFEDVASKWSEKENFRVVLETTQGDIHIELMPGIAPLAVANFVGHIENGYYDGLIFHRIIKDFMIQGGDPLGTGMGGESIWGKSFPDEFSPAVRFDTEGLLAMANSGPMTNGSQFFITTSQPEWLNDKHTIFGKVVQGYENVKKLESVETGPRDRPVEEQKILKAYLLPQSG